MLYALDVCNLDKRTTGFHDE